MPYIKQEIRTAINETPLAWVVPETPGELNYCITKLIVNYFQRNGERYQQVNDVIGALEGAKLEFYHRAARPVEDVACATRGDVY